MTLVPTLLAPALVLLIAVGGLLIFYLTDPRAKREPIDPRRTDRGNTFAKSPAHSPAKSPTRARRKML